MQLEEELSLRRAEIKNLQGQLRGSDVSSQGGRDGSDAQPEMSVPQEELTSAGHDPSTTKKYEMALAASQQEVDSLKAVVDSKSQEISEMKQKVQQAAQENMEMMDTWKVLRPLTY